MTVKELKKKLNELLKNGVITNNTKVFINLQDIEKEDVEVRFIYKDCEYLTLS